MKRLFRADLHVHSRCSDQSTHRGIRAFGSRESYTEPRELYDAARARGMDFVTITDHNTLAGALEIADLPGAFLGAEFDTWFPEHGCRIHVVALDIDEATFRDALQLRASVYELADFLRDAGVTHFVAHPLFDMGGTISATVVEKLILLFDLFEGRNGARTARCNTLAREILAALTPQRIAEYAERTGVEPRGATPWVKGLVAGSDDHSGLFAAGAYTGAACDGSLEGFLGAVRRGEAEIAGDDGDALMLAHSIYATGFWRLREILRLDDPAPRPRLGRLLHRGFGEIGRHVPILDKARRGLRSVAPGLYRDGRGAALEELLEREIGVLLGDPAALARTGSQELDRRIFSVVSRIVDEVMRLYLQPLADTRRRPGTRQVLVSAAGIGLTQLLALAYPIAWSNQTRDRALLHALRRQFLGEEAGSEKIAVFTDTLAEVNGVSLSVRRLAEAARHRGIELEVIESSAAPTASTDGVANFRATAVPTLPPYPEMPLVVPPLLDVLHYLDEGGFTAIHVSTPGSMGLLGLLAAKLLHLPVSGTYHTDLPRYAARLCRRRSWERNTWCYVMWFFGKLDEVFVPSHETRRQLVARGLDPARVKVLPHWVDRDLFSPARRDGSLRRRHDANGDATLVYAGRVSLEKSVDLLARAFRDVVDAGYSSQLVVAGDGPYRAEMERELAGYPALFLGFVPQEELADVLAAGDLFVFPSATDTCGLVVLEAQACGLPVIVTDRGGPREIMRRDVTGLVVPADDRGALTAAMRWLLDDPGRRRSMGAAARQFVLDSTAAPDAHGRAILSTLGAPPPAPGRRHPGGLRTVLRQVTSAGREP